MNQSTTKHFLSRAAIAVAALAVAGGAVMCARHHKQQAIRDDIERYTGTTCAEPQFSTRYVEFGTIDRHGGPVSRQVTVTNAGDCPLVITEGYTSCGCTTVDFPRDPVRPGRDATVTITFDPSGQSGHFLKHVSLEINCPEAMCRIAIEGEVAP